MTFDKSTAYCCCFCCRRYYRFVRSFVRPHCIGTKKQNANEKKHRVLRDDFLQISGKNNCGKPQQYSAKTRSRKSQMDTTQTQTDDTKARHTSNPTALPSKTVKATTNTRPPTLVCSCSPPPSFRMICDGQDLQEVTIIQYFQSVSNPYFR